MRAICVPQHIALTAVLYIVCAVSIATAQTPAQPSPTSEQQQKIQREIDTAKDLAKSIRERNQQNQINTVLGGFNNAVQLYKSTESKLLDALALPCLDPATLDALHSLVNDTIDQVSIFSKAVSNLNASSLTPAQLNQKQASIEQVKFWIGRLRYLVSLLNGKQPCPPPTPRTAGPPEQPVPPPPPKEAIPPPAGPETTPPPGPHEGGKCLTEEEEARLEALDHDDDLLSSQIAEYENLRNFQNSSLYKTDVEMYGETRALDKWNKLRDDFDHDPTLLDKLKKRRDEIRAEADKLRSKKCPETDMLMPSVPSDEKTPLPGTDTTKQEEPKAHTETQTEQGKKHPKKESRKKVTTKRSRRAAKHPTDADIPAGAGMSPETAHTIGTIIDIGVGVGLSRSRGHTGGHDNRGDAPKRVTPKSDR